MIHVYDTSSVAGKKAFHAGKEFFVFLKCDVGADNSGVSCMYLDRISVCIYIKNTSDRNLYRGAVGDQLYISGILRLPELDR